MESSTNSKTSIKSPIDWRIIGVIVALTIAYGIAVSQEVEGEFHVTDGMYLSGIVACGIMSLFVSKRYFGSEVFGKAYFFLGIGFLSWLVAEVIWHYHILVLNIDAYPAWWDPFFLAFYVLSIFHLVLNTRYFRRKWNSKIKAWLIGVPIIIVSGYIFTAYSEWGEYDELLFDLFYGALFIGLSSIVFTFAIFGAMIFRESALGNAWLLLAVGLVILGIADFGYYHLEISESFTLGHPLNSVWILAFMIIFYGLYKHLKVI